MKRILLSCAVLSLISFTACKNEAKDTDATVETTETTNDGAEATATEGVPTFSDSEVQKYVDDYTAFIKEYTAAAKSGDATKLSALAGNLQEWNTKSTAIGEKLATNPEDAQKFNEYIQKLALEMQAGM